MEPHPLAWRRVSTAALFSIQCALHVPWATPIDTVTLTPKTVYPQHGRMLVPPEACQDFRRREAVSPGQFDEKRTGTTTAMTLAISPATPFWQASDCEDVWASWTQTLPVSLRPAYPDRQRLREVAAGMRERGSPCLVESIVKADGIGSMTMRHLTTKIFAEEVGCDWLIPEWGMPAVGDGSGGSLYCHSAATYEEQQRGFGNTTEEGVQAMVQRCSFTNWLEYFNLKMSSVEAPANASFLVVEADTSSMEFLEGALEEIDVHGQDHLEWDHLKIVLSRSHASSNFLASLGSWDDWKRQAVRKVLRELRDNFHQFPRPWYDQAPECEYASSELNFALHLRMGDRRDIERVTPGYFSLLEDWMRTVAEEVEGRGHAAPMFHVFSEALYPCPSWENRTFNEFPLWPVERDQIPPCVDAKIPEDCPEKVAGHSCPPARSGTFRVEGKRLFLHVGRDVANTLSCMIHADGLLMGCSTFGQLAGILNRDGISFFSTACAGLGSPIQDMMIPPMAVAEKGHMWVPVAGSWRDPVLQAKNVLSAALDELLRNKGMSK
eukprot:g15895.t1